MDGFLTTTASYFFDLIVTYNIIDLNFQLENRKRAGCDFIVDCCVWWISFFVSYW